MLARGLPGGRMISLGGGPAPVLSFCLTRRASVAQYGVIRHVVRRHMESLPVTEPVLLILLSLAEQPRHGYAILQDVQEMSEGRVTLSTGTLYGALRRLLDDGWIERFHEEDNSR